MKQKQINLVKNYLEVDSCDYLYCLLFVHKVWYFQIIFIDSFLVLYHLRVNLVSNLLLKGYTWVESYHCLIVTPQLKLTMLVNLILVSFSYLVMTEHLIYL